MSGRVTPAKPKGSRLARAFTPDQPMGHKPVTKQRSPWRQYGPSADGDVPMTWWLRDVADGVLRSLVAQEPQGWHLSISFVNHRGDPTRYPTWDEQVDAVRQLLPKDLTYAMFITPDDEFVALHSTTFHWHEVES
jgi:hypothetical protein